MVFLMSLCFSGLRMQATMARVCLQCKTNNHSLLPEIIPAEIIDDGEEEMKTSTLKVWRPHITAWL